MRRGQFGPKLEKVPCYDTRKGGLGYVVSHRGIDVDKARTEVIERLPPLTFVKGVRRCLDHTAFYRCFFKDFSKTMKPLTLLLAKDTVLKHFIG